MKRRSLKTAFALISIISAILACNIPGQATEAPATEPPATAPATSTVLAPVADPPSPPPSEIPIQHQFIPVNLPDTRSGHAGDYDSSTTASAKKSAGGDRFTFEQFERPFNANTMDVYFPSLDIVDTFVYQDDTWIYSAIQVKDRAAENSSPYQFAMQLDLDLDGKGDWLVIASNPPSTDWTVEGVRVFQDANKDVGNRTPVRTDKNAKDGNGFETLIFDQGTGDDPDTAWIRVSSQDPNIVEIALKRSVLGDSRRYLVDMWAGHASLDPSLFDYSDHFTHEEAGAANPGFPAFYPIKAVYELDNSCRMAVGFQPTGDEPGLCIAPQQNRPGGACNPSSTELNACTNPNNNGTWNYSTCQCDNPPVIP